MGCSQDTDCQPGNVCTRNICIPRGKGPGPGPAKPPEPKDGNDPITPDQLTLLIQKVAIEITRLQASGTTDPVLRARVQVFEKIMKKLEEIRDNLQCGSLDPRDIPIKLQDYNKFLPAIGNSSAGIAGLLSKSGYSSLSSLFNAYDSGDVKGPQIAAQLFETYADSLLNGLSYQVNYTSPNEVAARQAEAIISQASLGGRAYAGQSGVMDTGHPMTCKGSRGDFDKKIRQLDMDEFEGRHPRHNSQYFDDNDYDGEYERIMGPPTNPRGAKFDWKERSVNICKNVKLMGLDPKDFGCDDDSKDPLRSNDFSWRGYAQMVCTRLATHSDPAMPVQLGCPPVSWKGWRQ